MEWLTNPLVIMAGQLIVGFALKRWPAFPNVFIPVANFVMALFGYSLVPTTAHAAEVDNVAKQAGWFITSPFIQAFWSTLATTGTHSFFKNLWQRVNGQKPWGGVIAAK